MAVVYAGWHEQLDRPVALKVLAEHLADDADFRTRFLREARIAARLHHPALVRTFDIAEVDGLPCIVMELLPGGTLEGGRLTTNEAAQVAGGLAYAHAQGVVHRDLKPANLLRSGHGEVKIADFGIARSAGETAITQVGTVLGTLRYLSPEQAAGETAGPEADVYALGAVLDDLLEDPPAEVRSLLDRARSDVPGLRPTAAEIAAVLSGETLVAPTQVVARHTARSRRPFVLLAVAAAAVVATIALVGTTGGSKPPAKVAPVAHGASTAAQARNLERWLRNYSR
jgi:serine/threonine protein kinase